MTSANVSNAFETQMNRKVLRNATSTPNSRCTQYMRSTSDSLWMALTRLRTSSHRLRIETGRWARTPREQRLCSCGVAIQDERHAIVDCVQVEHIRNKHLHQSAIDFHTFINLMPSTADLCLINDILSFFADNDNNNNDDD